MLKYAHDIFIYRDMLQVQSKLSMNGTDEMNEGGNMNNQTKASIVKSTRTCANNEKLGIKQ